MDRKINKKGVVLILGVLVVVVLSTLLASFFYKTMNEHNMVRRHVNSIRAFWLAEAGIAEGIRQIPNNTSGWVDDINHYYNVTTTHLNGTYYCINSTGSVALPPSGLIQRRVSAVVETNQAIPNKFQYAIETTVDLITKGSVDINPNDSYKEFSTLNFADLFGFTKETIRSYAQDYFNHLYTGGIPDGASVSGITWVESPGTVAGNWHGDGILVFVGDTHISGSIVFDGIIYVIGKLTITGTVVTSGSVLAESSAEVEKTELKGNPTLNYDQAAIENALSVLQFLSARIVSWRELELEPKLPD